MRNIRVLALAALTVAAVGSAQAFTFEFNTVGKYTVTAGTLSVSDNLVTYDPSNLVKSIAYSYSVPGPAVAGGTGTITLKDASTINFLFNGTITNGSNSDALSGNVVTFSGGTGALANLQGTGSISNTTWKSGADQTTFVAELEAVPEPASMAVLGIGLVGIAARRRRSK